MTRELHLGLYAFGSNDQEATFYVATSLVNAFERHYQEGSIPVAEDGWCHVLFKPIEGRLVITPDALEHIVNDYTRRQPQTEVSVPVPPEPERFGDRPTTLEGSGKPSGDFLAVRKK